MTLKKLLKLSGWTEERLVEALRLRGMETTQSTVNRIRNRRRTASLGLALAIEDATRGEVSAEEVPLSRATKAALRRVRALNGGAGQPDAESPPSGSPPQPEGPDVLPGSQEPPR